MCFCDDMFVYFYRGEQQEAVETSEQQPLQDAERQRKSKGINGNVAHPVVTQQTMAALPGSI